MTQTTETIDTFNKRNLIFKKHKKIIGSIQKTTTFEEPILILMRRTRTAEFYENAKGDEFEYEHSSGENRKIYLNTKYLQSFPYGDKIFQGYICHEDHPVPLPNDPVITTDTMGTIIDKVLNDMKLWRVEEAKAKAKLWQIIIFGAIGLILAYAVFKMLNPTVAPKVAETAIQNITNATTMLKPTIIT